MMHQAVELSHDDLAPAPAPAVLLRSCNPYGVPHEVQIEAVVDAIMAENPALRHAGSNDLAARVRLRLNREALMDLSSALTKLRMGAAVSALQCQDSDTVQGAPLLLVHCRPEGGDAISRQDLRSRGEPRFKATPP